jgi:cytochrome c oxidase subunit 4
MREPTLSSRAYVLAYLALMGLLLANVLIGMVNLGWVNMFIAVTIAAIQGGIIALVLMHGLFEKRLIRIVMGGALLWFMILVTLTMTDYITRNWLPIAGK